MEESASSGGSAPKKASSTPAISRDTPQSGVSDAFKSATVAAKDKLKDTKEVAKEKLKDTKEALRHVQLPGYGTLDADLLPKPDKLGWFQRGWVVMLGQELISNYFAYCVLVFYMCIAPFCGRVSIDIKFSCEIGKDYIKSDIGSMICYYTKTYVWSFPQLAGATLLLLMGRDLAQKRFYYMLLKHGCVMNFMRMPLLRDNLLVVNIFAFGHFFAFVVLVGVRLYLSGFDMKTVGIDAAKAVYQASMNPNGPASQRFTKAGAPEDPVGLQIFIQLLVFLGLPGCLFIMKLIFSYDIERTLVPLSEYVRDVTTGVHASSPKGHGEDDVSDDGGSEAPDVFDLSQLVSCKDNRMRFLMDQRINDFADPSERSGRQRELYARLIATYMAEPWHKEPARTELADGLWPVPFLMTHRPSRLLSTSWSYPLVWRSYRNLSLLLITFFIFCQVVGFCVDIYTIHIGKRMAVFSLPGMILNIFILSWIWQRFWVAKAHTNTASAVEGYSSDF